MSRGFWMLILVGLLSSAGCCMCAAPYDYCGPDCIGPYCDNPEWCSRVGSVYSPYGPPPMVGEYPADGNVPPEPMTEDDYYNDRYQESPGDARPMIEENLVPPDNRSAAHGPMLNRR